MTDFADSNLPSTQLISRQMTDKEDKVENYRRNRTGKNREREIEGMKELIKRKTVAVGLIDSEVYRLIAQ